MTDLFDITGRHWRVSSGMVTAATVTVTVVTVTVSSCPSSSWEKWEQLLP